MHGADSHFIVPGHNGCNIRIFVQQILGGLESFFLFKFSIRPGEVFFRDPVIDTMPFKRSEEIHGGLNTGARDNAYGPVSQLG